MSGNGCMKKQSVVVDTNIFISALIIPQSKPAKIITHIKQNMFDLVISHPLLQELEDVLKRSKYEKRYHISKNTTQKLISYIRQNSRIVEQLNKPKIEIRDIKDTTILATAIDGKADFLITGDNDLLMLKDAPAISPLKIITVDNFIKLIEAEYRF